MPSNTLFEWLVAYHVQKNLPACRERISEEGVYRSSRPLRPGLDEIANEEYTGLLIFSNGDELINRLRDVGVINDSKEPEFVPVREYMEFQRLLDEEGGRDGAFAYNSKRGLMARVLELNNRLPSPSYEQCLPRNFVNEEGSIAPTEGVIGTKTRAAIKVSASYSNVDAFQIKRTAYNKLGMGIVTHFRNGCLEEMFYFTQAPEGSGLPVLDPKTRIVGVYKRFSSEGGSPKESYTAVLTGINSQGRLELYTIKPTQLEKGH